MSTYINVSLTLLFGGGDGGGDGCDFKTYRKWKKSTMRNCKIIRHDGQESKLSEGHRHSAFALQVCVVRLCQSRNLTIASKA